MSRSVGRLKVVVETVGREVVREPRKNQFSIILETKERLETGRQFFNSFWARDFFLRRGVTRAVLKTSGTKDARG